MDMRKMTEADLRAAFAGESQAHMRYKIFAAKAREEGLPNIGRLFDAISYAEQVHATNHLRALNGVGMTAENLGEAIGGENYEVDEMYPAFMAVAKLQEEKAAVLSMHYAIEAEKIHASMYESAQQSAVEKKDINLGDMQICGTCGYTVEGQAPDKCPVCGATKDKFSKF
jgi:rubrerythrin